MLGVDVTPSLILVAASVVVLQFPGCDGAEEFKTVDVAKLSKLERGTESPKIISKKLQLIDWAANVERQLIGKMKMIYYLVLIESGYDDHKTYKLEDFFWTGSGDGSPDGDSQSPWVSETPTTVYKTKTVLSTIYVQTPSTHFNQVEPEGTTNCPFNCEAPVTPDGEITPTPTYQPNDQDDVPNNTDRQFWLLTVLKTDGKNPIITDIKNSLAKLYKTAFQRQQERHLGITKRSKREVTDLDKPVNVYIINVTHFMNNGNEKIEVLYHVSVSGQPVSAITAAADMHLVSDEEVTNELGYPFIIKAEPYVKVSDPQYLASSNNTWIFIGVALTILFVLLLLVALLTLAMSKRSKSPMALPNKKQVFHQSVGVGHSNNAFVSTETERKDYPDHRRQSSTYIDFRNQPSNQTLKSGATGNRPRSASSSSSFSATSLDISPLMSLNKRQRSPPRRINMPRPKAALNKTAPLKPKRRASLVLDSDSSSDRTRRDSSDTILIKSYDPGVISPKSYLSMPSVKSFPRGNIPEPLNKVLEPVSVLHLDIGDDDDPELLEPDRKYNNLFTRYGSLSAVEDPGVIGPVVWSEHCKKLQRGVSVDEGIDDVKSSNNASRMRKRFHDLLDETFSLFGSRRDSPVEEGRAVPLEVKSHSANINRPTEETRTNLYPRPKTSDPRRTAPNTKPPRGAWATNAPSPLDRPLSAGPFQKSNTPPQVDVDRILAQGTLQPNDPAVPLIAAIKTELGKCSLPGSTTNLVE